MQGLEIDLPATLEVINLILVIVGGFMAFSVFQRLRGGKMASGILLILVAGGVFAIHETIAVLFAWVWPQPWHGLAYGLSETAFIVAFILAIFRLKQSLPRGV